MSCDVTVCMLACDATATCGYLLCRCTEYGLENCLVPTVLQERPPSLAGDSFEWHVDDQHCFAD